MPLCSAFGCNNKTNRQGYVTKEGVTFHKFPEDPTKKLAWILATGRQNWDPTPLSHLCSEHFEERFIDRSGNYVKIHEDGIPTIFKAYPNQARKRKVLTAFSSDDEIEDQQKLYGYENQENLDDYENLENTDEYDNMECLDDLNQTDTNEYNNQEQNHRVSENEYSDEIFICTIRDNPILYNKCDPDYWRKSKQNQTWRALADVLIMSAKECRQRWEDLLLKYTKQRDIVLRFKARGHRATPKWPLYDVMNFMDKHVDNNTTKTKCHKTSRTENNVEANNRSQILYNAENSRSSFDEDNLGLDNDSFSASYSEGYETNSECHSRPEVINHLTQSSLIRISDNVSATKRVITDINEDVQFVNSLLPILVRMPRKKKAQCKAELMAILANYESEDE